jgi:hypothetical protein
MPNPPDLHGRLAAVGKRLGAREAEHRSALDDASQRARTLHDAVERGLAAFHEAFRQQGVDHFQVELGPVRLDEKHARSIQFDLRRGRHAGIVTVKSRGEVTLVGPFRTGKNEGPCLSFPFDAEDELDKALGDFLEQFLDEAAAP